MQSAIERLGHTVVLVESNGHIRWTRHHGRDLLRTYFPLPAWQQDRLPSSILAWLRAQHARACDVTTVPPPPSPLLIPHNGRALRIHLIVESDHDCLVLEETGTGMHTDTQAASGLTARECEVLTWVAQGKSNADIAIILAQARAQFRNISNGFFRSSVWKTARPPSPPPRATSPRDCRRSPPGSVPLGGNRGRENGHRRSAGGFRFLLGIIP